MANWWESAPLVEAPAQNANANWWESAPLVEQQEQTAPSQMGSGEAFLRGAGQGATFGTLDEMNAAASASPIPGGENVNRYVPNPIDLAAGAVRMGAEYLAPGWFGSGGGEAYDARLEHERASNKQAEQDAPIAYMGGQIAGGIAPGVGMAGAGLSAATNAARAGGTLGRVALGSAWDGAIMGALYGSGSGEGVSGRVGGASTGAAAGFAVGGAAPYAMAGLQSAISPIVRPIMSRLRPEAYADRAMADTLRRSGMELSDVTDDLARARADGQDMYTVADALGNAGQRRLSAMARTPNDARQAVVEGLQARQMGQGERLSNFLAEGFAAPDTAAQRAASLTAARSAAADTSYEAARQGAGAVDVSGAIRAADDLLSPGISRLASPQTNIADDSIEAVVGRARRLLTDGRSNLSDFTSVLRAEQDISDMIGSAQRAGRNNQVRLLSQINRELDGALEAASPDYRLANDTFRAQSRAIDAVDTGVAAASGRTRATDNIQAFNAMPADQQSAFRAGYADPYIARVEAMASSPTTNKARGLITEKTAQEFPAFAAPGQADRLRARIAREQRMFETTNAALGGSKTADNLADAADLGGFDSDIAMNLMQGRPTAAALGGIGRFLSREQQGLSPGVTERLARALMSTDAGAVQNLLGQAQRSMTRDEVRRAFAAMIMGQQAGAGAAR